MKTLAGQNSNSAQLIASCQGLVRSIAWKIHRRVPSSVDLDDLIGYGQIGLAQAARDYDPSRGTRFTTFAYYRIRGSILDGLSTMAWFNKADYNRGRYQRLADDYLNDDTDNQSADQLRDDARWFGNTTASLATVYLLSQHGRNEEQGMELGGADESRPEDGVILNDLAEKLRDRVATLPDDARQLIEGVYFEGLTIKDAGERIGVGKAWASRLHARTLRQLAFGLAEGAD